MIKSPAFCQTGPELVRRLKKRLDLIECGPGKNLTQKQFGEVLGVPKSTMNDWFVDPLPEPIQALLCGLERLPETERILFLREFCRECPRLCHPWIAHDPEVVTALERILTQRSGLTVIIGQPKRLQTFLLTAFGNSLGRLDPKHRCCGLDLYNPMEFTPVPGVHYACERQGPGPMGHLITEIWPQLRDSKAELFLLNGVLSMVPQMGPEIMRCSRSRHVILADDFPSGFPAFQANVIRVSNDKFRPKLLRASIVRSC